jgi:hypothetical protein
VRYESIRTTEWWSESIVAQDDGNDDDQSRRVFQLATFHGGRIVWHRMVRARDPMCMRPIPVGVWLHVAAVYEEGEHRIYLNGERHDAVSHGLWTHPSQPIHIGRKGTDEEAFFFHGDIGDVRLYDYALSDADVRGLCEDGGWRPAMPPATSAADPISGLWGPGGGRRVVVMDLRLDVQRGGHELVGEIMAGKPGNMAPIRKGSFDRATGALHLEGTGRHPDEGYDVPYSIHGRLADGEISVAARFEMRDHVHDWNYILARLSISE